MMGRALFFTALAGLGSSTIYLLLVVIAAFRWRFAPPEPAPSGYGRGGVATRSRLEAAAGDGTTSGTESGEFFPAGLSPF